MLDANALIAHSSDFLNASKCDTELKQRLGLYQLFLKLYDHNRSLLDEILNLENSSSRASVGVNRYFMQGLVFNNDVYLVTNLLGGKTQSWFQSDHIWTVGRDPKQVVMPISDSRLSRCHAVIRYADDQNFYITDLGSSNGTFVNGERVRPCFRLRDGDRIRLGTLTFNFYICHKTKSLDAISSDMLHRLAEAGALPVTNPHVPASPPQNQAIASESNEEKTHRLPSDETLQFMRSAKF
ncbi:MAG: FHA domain-containing protein [Elainellaceae cyanobacterium]